MRKILLFGIVMSLFSCSTDNQTVLDDEVNKESKTIDPAIGYYSPYEYSPVHGLHIGAGFTYRMINNTDLNFEFTPFLGLGSYDGDPFSNTYWHPSYGIGDPSSSYYTPNLSANGVKYGNFLPAEPIHLPPFRNRSINTVNHYPVPIDLPGGTNGFVCDYPGSAYVYEDGYFLQKSGKLFFIEFKVRDQTNRIIANSKVRMNFPYNLDVTTTTDWFNVGIVDSYFGEELVYNKFTREICLVIKSSSPVKDIYRFTYQNRRFQVGMRSTANNIDIYLREI